MATTVATPTLRSPAALPSMITQSSFGADGAPLYHVFGDEMPMPMRGASLLVEIEYETIQSALVLVTAETQLNVATVRGLSPLVPEVIGRALLPDGQGSVGARVITGDNHFELLGSADYELFGLEEPTDENGLRLLAFVSLPRVTGYIPEDGQERPLTAGILPFIPLGERVFLKFDKSDVAPLFKDGAVNEDAIVLEASGLYVPEQAQAARNNIATVIGFGELAEGIAIGDRVVAPKQEGSVEFDGETFYYVPRPGSLVCKVAPTPKPETHQTENGDLYLDGRATFSGTLSGDGSSTALPLPATDLSHVDCPSPDLCLATGCQSECLAANADEFQDPVTGLMAADFTGRIGNGYYTDGKLTGIEIGMPDEPLTLTHSEPHNWIINESTTHGDIDLYVPRSESGRTEQVFVRAGIEVVWMLEDETPEQATARFAAAAALPLLRRRDDDAPSGEADAE